MPFGDVVYVTKKAVFDGRTSSPALLAIETFDHAERFDKTKETPTCRKEIVSPFGASSFLALTLRLRTTTESQVFFAHSFLRKARRKVSFVARTFRL